ncbi:MAG: 50S ribosomal protein L3 [Planctomycetes bacterium]|nr:50S ribosomal protein L3 [Planctomycetota bacterium]
MLPSLLGRKVGMTQIFAENGNVTPVTVLECGPCPVLQIKKSSSEGYNAVQLGFVDGKKKRATRAMLGHFKKANIETPKRFIREVRLPDGAEGEKITAQFKLGDQVKVDVFENTWKVDVVGITKGRGFTGLVKRWNKKRGPAGHGSMNVRGSGAIGSDTRLTHIRPGKTMPGHYGVERVMVKNLEVMKIDKNRNLLFVKGAVAGANGGFVIVRKTDLVKPVPKVVASKKKIESKKKK